MPDDQLPRTEARDLHGRTFRHAQAQRMCAEFWHPHASTSDSDLASQRAISLQLTASVPGNEPVAYRSEFGCRRSFQTIAAASAIKALALGILLLAGGPG